MAVDANILGKLDNGFAVPQGRYPHDFSDVKTLRLAFRIGDFDKAVFDDDGTFGERGLQAPPPFASAVGSVKATPLHVRQ